MKHLQKKIGVDYAPQWQISLASTVDKDHDIILNFVCLYFFYSQIMQPTNSAYSQ